MYNAMFSKKKFCCKPAERITCLYAKLSLTQLCMQTSGKDLGWLVKLGSRCSDTLEQSGSLLILRTILQTCEQLKQSE